MRGMYQPESLNLIEAGQAVHVRAAAASASLLTTLGVRPLIGRAFGPRANQPGAAGRVILSYRLWSRLFDRNRAVLGRVVTLNGTACTVIGVMPQTFQFPRSRYGSLDSQTDRPLRARAGQPDRLE